ncbi:MAG: hypothetical protein H0X73_09460 [Chthoniobacterales bacterium]|nr:hypothetical protein [Chthoniobacterales bacterium]
MIGRCDGLLRCGFEGQAKPYRRCALRLQVKLICPLLLVFVAAAFSSCSTMTDMVSAHIPQRHSGRTSVEVGSHATPALQAGSRRAVQATRIGTPVVVKP